MIVSLAAVVVLVLAVSRRSSPVETADEADRTTGVSIESEPVTTVPPEPPEPFLVVGSTIIDSDDREFVPVGANVAISAVDYPFVFEGGNGGVNGHVDAVKAWGWNTVRATLSCDGADNGPSREEIIDGIKPTITELTEAGIVVIISCHDATGSAPALDGEVEQEVRAFWDEVAPAYADNPLVWFNFFNEPFADDDLEAWSALHSFYLERYRSQGIENIAIVDLPVFGQAIDLAADEAIASTVDGVCNTVIGWHAWGSIDGEQATLADYESGLAAAREAGLAVLVEEAGVPDPMEAGTAGNPEWNESGFNHAVEVAEANNIGMLWWHGTGDTADELFYPLTADATGFWTAADGENLSPAGERFRAFSELPRSASVSDLDLVDSGCTDLGNR